MERSVLSAKRSERKIARIQARLARSPNNARLYQGLGWAMLGLACQNPDARPGDIETALRRSLELAPNDPWTHLYLAHMFYSQQLYDQSLAAAKRAHDLRPKEAIALILMADAYAALRDYVHADTCFHKAVEVDPHYEVGRKNLARWLAFWLPEQERRRAAAAEGGRSRHRRAREEPDDE